MLLAASQHKWYVQQFTIPKNLVHFLKYFLIIQKLLT
jgi:hypothetical protein